MSEHKVLVLGGTGFAGSWIYKQLISAGHRAVAVGTREVDLLDWSSVKALFAKLKPTFVINAAGSVGGIGLNSSNNLIQYVLNAQMGLNVVRAVSEYEVPNLLNLSSSCTYPTTEPRPLKENSVMGKDFEQTNIGYALAKYAISESASLLSETSGCSVLTVVPCNIYGPGDYYDNAKSHVVAALVAKIHTAKMTHSECVLWGDGTPKREFLYVEDLALGITHVLNIWEKLNYRYLNIGSGYGITIIELAGLIADVVGFQGEIVFDREMPNGVADKTMSIERALGLGWTPLTSMKDGLTKTYQDYIQRQGLKLEV